MKDVTQEWDLKADVQTEEETDGEVDFYRMYMDEISGIAPCTEEEEGQLLQELLDGNSEARSRLLEGNLEWVVSLAEEYRDQGLSMGDLVQEANMALLLAIRDYEGGSFHKQAETEIRAALEEALRVQREEMDIEEEMAARVNVLKDISAGMARELGREATVTELAERMKMTEEEIRDIMKLTLDAMSVSGEAMS